MLPARPVSSRSQYFRTVAMTVRDIPSISHTSFDVFQNLLSEGIPMVIRGVHARLDGEWTPAAFSERYGSEVVTIVDSRKNIPVKMRLDEFFRLFELDDGQLDGVIKLKASAVIVMP